MNKIDNEIGKAFIECSIEELTYMLKQGKNVSEIRKYILENREYMSLKYAGLRRIVELIAATKDIPEMLNHIIDNVMPTLDSGIMCEMLRNLENIPELREYIEKKLNIEEMMEDSTQEDNVALLRVLSEYKGELISEELCEKIKAELEKKCVEYWQAFLRNEFFKLEDIVQLIMAGKDIPEARKYIITNFEKIFINVTGTDYFEEVISELAGVEEFKPIIKEWLAKILEITAGREDGINNAQNIIFIINNIMKDELYRKEIEENAETIVGVCFYANVVWLRELAKKFNGFSEIMKKNYYELERTAVEQGIEVEDLYLNRLIEYAMGNQVSEEVLIVVRLLFKDALRNENKKITDIKLIGKGSFSTVYNIGNKAVKIGEGRATKEIENHRRILQPAYRNEIIAEGKVDKKDEVVKIFAEMSEMVDTEGITEEDVYVVYKELIEDGKAWVDSYTDNLGRLRRKNVSYHTWAKRELKEGEIGNEEFYSPESMTGIKGEQQEPLGEGELIVFDTDYIYIYNNIKDCYGWRPKESKVEIRYQAEKKLEKLLKAIELIKEQESTR